MNNIYLKKFQQLVTVLLDGTDRVTIINSLRNELYNIFSVDQCAPFVITSHIYESNISTTSEKYSHDPAERFGWCSLNVEYYASSARLFRRMRNTLTHHQEISNSLFNGAMKIILHLWNTSECLPKSVICEQIKRLMKQLIPILRIVTGDDIRVSNDIVNNTPIDDKVIDRSLLNIDNNVGSLRYIMHLPQHNMNDEILQKISDSIEILQSLRGDLLLLSVGHTTTMATTDVQQHIITGTEMTLAYIKLMGWKNSMQKAMIIQILNGKRAGSIAQIMSWSGTVARINIDGVKSSLNINSKVRIL